MGAFPTLQVNLWGRGPGGHTPTWGKVWATRYVAFVIKSAICNPHNRHSIGLLLPHLLGALFLLDDWQVFKILINKNKSEDDPSFSKDLGNVRMGHKNNRLIVQMRNRNVDN